jgi:hypothetical protein
VIVPFELLTRAEHRTITVFPQNLICAMGTVPCHLRTSSRVEHAIALNII